MLWKKILNLLIFISFLFYLSCKKEEDNTLPESFMIIPHPQKVEMLRGKGLSFGELSNLKMDGEFQRPVMGHILYQLTESGDNGRETLTLRLIKEGSGIDNDSPESYVLIIKGKNAEIISTGEAGLFYGCQTLEQLLEDSRDYNTAIPACKITDYPKLEYRAALIDVKNHLDHMRVYYETIDMLGRYKINAVIFEFEDKLRYKRQPLVGASHAMSIDEIAALTSYARDRHIEISPLVQGCGHATYILKHEHYAKLLELDWNIWAFCPLDEGTYKVLFDLYLDAMEATPGSRYLHIGGDEIGNIGLCPRCKPTADKEGLMSLYVYWFERVCEFIKANGRIPILWDDMLLKSAGVLRTSSRITESQLDEIWREGEPKLQKAISDFPTNCIFMRWNYTMARQPGNIRILDWYRDNGVKAWIATAAQSGPALLFPFDDRDRGMASRGLPAIQSFIQLAAEKDINGMLCNAWDPRSPHFETFRRGRIAAAEYSWNPDARTLEEYDIAYLQREYGISLQNYSNLYGKLREKTVFWEEAFNKEGSRQDPKNALFNLPGIAHYDPPIKPKGDRTDFTGLLLELPDLQRPGTWSEKYSERLKQAVHFEENYKAIADTLKTLYNNSRRNRYHWEIFMVQHDFISTVPHLLLALEQCDTFDIAAQKTGLENVREAIREFDRSWENLNSVYSKTRFISYPDDYVPDRYYHPATQREDLTFLIQVEELFHEMINEWMAEM